MWVKIVKSCYCRSASYTIRGIFVVTTTTWMSEVHQSVQARVLFKHIVNFSINHEIIHACIANVKNATRYEIEIYFFKCSVWIYTHVYGVFIEPNNVFASSSLNWRNWMIQKTYKVTTILTVCHMIIPH